MIGSPKWTILKLDLFEYFITQKSALVDEREQKCNNWISAFNCTLSPIGKINTVVAKWNQPNFVFSNIQMKRWLIRTIVLFYCLTYHRWVRKIQSKMKYSDESKFLFIGHSWFMPFLCYYPHWISKNFAPQILQRILLSKKRSFIQRFFFFYSGKVLVCS